MSGSLSEVGRVSWSKWIATCNVGGGGVQLRFREGSGV